MSTGVLTASKWLLNWSLFVNLLFSLHYRTLQEGMDEDWPLEIYDHAGRVHRVHMEPGDIVLYVSSKKKPWGDVACQLIM